MVERDRIIDGSEVRVGDQLIGLGSSGVHSNGYSLVRKICFEELGLKVTDQIPELGETLGEALLRPTRIYTEPLLNLIKNFKVRGLAHITGGGFIDNIPRVLPDSTKAVIANKSWQVPALFDFLRVKGEVSPEEMLRTFNCGIGMIVIVDPKEADDAMQQLTALGETPFRIGEIAARKEGEPSVEIDCAGALGC